MSGIVQKVFIMLNTLLRTKLIKIGDKWELSIYYADKKRKTEQKTDAPSLMQERRIMME